ncbi:hypothetical protein QN277_007035 [Acacia crassicarpa]|uniref:AIG1-type G domain-containing protein n=1 Tax=Acacia crassicarpa TaxID=499986 RepID=A0AAE1IUI1_9FABA|nr:hypothetical protein QN277_007035 [Acacia crassicarpa]
MKSVRDWVFSQLLSTSLISSRPLSGSGSFYDEGPQNGGYEGQGLAQSDGLAVPSHASTTSNSSDQHDSTMQQISDMEPSHSQHRLIEKRKDPLAKIEDLQVKFFRLLRRLGQSQEDLLVAKVLYRMHLATLIRAGESDLKSVNLSTERSRALASQQEALGVPQLDFSCTILVLGKTGVGKSATINSIFDQAKTITDAFGPATNRIQEVVGTVSGFKIRVIDTPGLLPSSTSNLKKNKRILLSIKRFIRKSPPDVVLFVERLDLINVGCNDFPILKLVTEIFGTAIWFNTIFVFTHSHSAILEGPDGHIVNHDLYVSQCTKLLQRYTHQAVSDSRLENPILLVENHPLCPKNIMGEKILPNGKVWRSQFLLFCICTKILADVNSLLKFQNSVELGPPNSARMPSLPHLLSSLLRRHSVSHPSGMDDEIAQILLNDMEEEDEYDELPPIQILKKAQFEKLSKEQKEEYLDELDYRETLYLKKQLKEEYSRHREKTLLKEQNLSPTDHPDDQQEPPEPVLLPDIAVPVSFDSDCPLHRYRGLVASDQWLARPVLDPQGWDHDVSFDGINLETAMEINKNAYAMLTGQMNKDKQNFSVQSECAAAYVDPRGLTNSVGVDVQSVGNDTICTIHSNTKLRNIKHNIADCGVSVTSFAKKYYIGAKIEDTLLVGNRLKFVLNAGRIVGAGQVAYGGNFEATLRGGDFPARNDNVSLAMTVLSSNKEMVLSGSLQSEFRLGRNSRASVSANLNSRKMGKICIKTSSSEHLQFALVAVFTIFSGLLRTKAADNMSKDEAMDEG